MPPSFSINFDYRCPFARNANEHVAVALKGGADLDVEFKGFSLSEVHVADGEMSVFDIADRQSELMAIAAGIVVRDRMPEAFLDAHVSLFAIRHDDGDDIRDSAKIHHALTRAGVDADAVFAELEDGWPYEVLRSEHHASVKEHSVFGVPTFITGDQAVFVRVMTRPEGDVDRATTTINHVLSLLAGYPELNEYKHTSIPR